MIRKNKIFNIFLFLLLHIFLLSNACAIDKNNNKYAGAELYQTQSRFIIISTNAKDCNDPSICSSVTYYEINKKTGISLMLKGEPITRGETMDFKGYDFKNKHNKYLYRILIPSNILFIYDKDTVILEETLKDMRE